MITEALQHCPGIGPVRLSQLRESGVRSWQDVLHQPDRIPLSVRASVTEESLRCLAALDDQNIGYFVERLVPQDRWRILAEFLDRVTFFDIETTGLEWDAGITVIACWHQGALHTFVEHENLDEFVELLESVELLVSFNGSAFDVPRVVSTFHLMELPCPHLDMRWTCYHRGLLGSLKQIATTLGIERPADLADVDGALAVQLWQQWTGYEDEVARRHLVRYCAADVLLLVMVAQHMHGAGASDELWAKLPDVVGQDGAQGQIDSTWRTVANANPTAWRGRRVRFAC